MSVQSNIEQRSIHHDPLVGMLLQPLLLVMLVTTLRQRCRWRLFSTLEDEMRACWKTDNTVDHPLLPTLASPAPQSLFVWERAVKKVGWEKTWRECSYLFKEAYHMVQTEEDWQILPITEPLVEGERVVPRKHALRGPQLVTNATTLKEQMELTLGTDLRGRTSADTALSLALEGVPDESLYRQLTLVAQLELERTRRRKNTKDALHMVERLAAAGIRSAPDLHASALDIVGEQEVDTVAQMRLGTLDLLSERPLLWLWRASAARKKEKVAKSYDAVDLPRTGRPLVLDLGCGMGVSLLGLADGATKNATLDLLPDKVSWEDCDFVGADLSEPSLRFASGIAQRWGLQSKLHFVRLPVEQMLDQVTTPVALTLLQFPTPYRLEADADSGNEQLPSGPESGFMVTRRVLEKSHSLMKPVNGRLLLQSNCEDVAVYMQQLAQDCGFAPIEAKHSVSQPQAGRGTKRLEAWLSQRETLPRAVGSEWSLEALLPSRCRTETEVSCSVSGTPVHRCLLQAQ